MKASDVLPRFYLGRFFSVYPLSVWRAGTHLECQFGELEGGAACRVSLKGWLCPVLNVI